jgi:uncharacterized glyoxalase superfamily protein PhnB
MPLSVLMRCRNLEETRQFYRSALGFDVRDSAKGTLTAEHQGGVLIFTPEDLWEGQPSFSGTIYFVVTDADSYFAYVKDKATVIWPLQDMHYGSREFGITDCNGYCLAFQQQV